MILDVEAGRVDCLIINNFDDDRNGEQIEPNTSIPNLIVSIQRLIDALDMLDSCKIYCRPWQEKLKNKSMI